MPCDMYMSTDLAYLCRVDIADGYLSANSSDFSQPAAALSNN